MLKGMKAGLKKLESLGYDGEMHMILRLLVLTHYQRVTDGHAACSNVALQHS